MEGGILSILAGGKVYRFHTKPPRIGCVDVSLLYSRYPQPYGESTNIKLIERNENQTI